jgi:drug/metabolite transporter (DMT)-like permease
MATNKPHALPGEGLAHLGVVYLVWSSTYLAIRVAMRPGAGFAPFSFVGPRCILAFPFLLAWARWRGLRLAPTRSELPLLVTSGVLLWTFGNALVVVAEQHVSSALAAILIASTPIWVAMLEGVVDRRLPSRMVIAALLVGFLGTGLIGYPSLRGGVHADSIAVGTLLVAALSWAAGSLLQRRRPVTLDAMVSAAYQMLFGGLASLLLALLFREPWPHPSGAAWAAFVFLLIFGSIISFTSFLKALRLLPTHVVFTYSYVNPVLATFLGWALLGERLPPIAIAGGALVLLGVTVAFRGHA